jgi:uncharacterized Zn finger protein
MSRENAKMPKSDIKKKPPNRPPEPVIVHGRKMAVTWWGNAWNQNLESYADYENRIARGRSYLRKGAVIDLHIEQGVVSASVQGSRRSPYKVSIQIDPLSDQEWDRIAKQCSRRIENIDSLVSGAFPEDLGVLFSQKGTGLFPDPKQISFSCSCPDWAYMCKHVAAVLYGIGARLDEDPLLFFKLRNIHIKDLLQKSIDEKVESMLKNAGSKTSRTIGFDEAKDLFGV